MTVFMVKKYLVTKLGLSNEAEVISLSLSLSDCIYFHFVLRYIIKAKHA